MAAFAMNTSNPAPTKAAKLGKCNTIFGECQGPWVGSDSLLNDGRLNSHSAQTIVNSSSANRKEDFMRSSSLQVATKILTPIQDTPAEVITICKAVTILTLIGIMLITLMFNYWRYRKKHSFAISKTKYDKAVKAHSGYNVVESDSGEIVAIRTDPYAPPVKSTSVQG
jgi:hypothetical protein